MWNKLNYNSTCLANASGSSEIFFEASTAPDVMGVPGVYSLNYELAEAKTNGPPGPPQADPEKCTSLLPFPQAPLYAWASCSGPATPNCCPKDIETLFSRPVGGLPFEGAGPAAGALLARQDWLRLSVTIKSTPDALKDATLTDLSISYQCVARE